MADFIIIFNQILEVIKYGWPFALITMLIVAKIKGKQWPVDVQIIEKRGKNLIKTNDRAGKYEDKFTGLTGYKLMKSKDTIPVIDYNWVVHNMDKPLSIFDRITKFLRPTIGTLFLFRYGSKQYKPIKIRDNEDAKIEYESIKNDNGEPILIERYQQFDPRGYLEALNLEIVDWDNMNFMVQEIRASQERRKKKDAWLKTILIPIAMLAVTAIICIVMMKFSMDHSQSLNTGATSNNQGEKAELPNIPIVGDAFSGK